MSASPSAVRVVTDSACDLPQSVADELGLVAGGQVDVAVVDDCLVAKVRKRPRYTLSELLAQCDPTAPRDPIVEEWLNAPSVGREIVD